MICFDLLFVEEHLARLDRRPEQNGDGHETGVEPRDEPDDASSAVVGA